jgi:hypothetical protein
MIDFKKPIFNFCQIKNLLILKKNFWPVLLFIFVLLAGFLVFQGQERQKQKDYLVALQKIQEKVAQAENFIILKDANPDAKKQALSLLSETWIEIIPMTKLDGAIRDLALAEKEKIDSDLKDLNNLTKIDEPELIFEFDKQTFIPQKIIFNENSLYLFSPYVQDIFKIDNDSSSQFIDGGQKANEANVISDSSVLLFSKPDKIIFLKDDKVEETFFLKSFYSDFNFTNFTSFKENVYFFDTDTGEITRYGIPLAGDKDNPYKWFYNKNVQKPAGGKSIAVDGSVWILAKNNNFLKYYAGYLQETIIPSVFPEPKSLSKIIIPFGSPYIFALESVQKRVIIFDKEGKVVRQFESEKFDNLLDFTVSQNNKNIWLLNAQKIYKISL